MGKGIQEIREEPLKGESINPVKGNMVNDDMKLSILNSYDSKYSWIQRKRNKFSTLIYPRVRRR